MHYRICKLDKGTSHLYKAVNIFIVTDRPKIPMSASGSSVSHSKMCLFKSLKSWRVAIAAGTGPATYTVDLTKSPKRRILWILDLCGAQLGIYEPLYTWRLYKT